MNLKDKAYLKKFHVKESSILIGLENFGATEFFIMGWLGWYSLYQTKNDQISTQGISIRIGRFPVQTPLDVLAGLLAQPRYEAPGDLQVEIVGKRSD